MEKRKYSGVRPDDSKFSRYADEDSSEDVIIEEKKEAITERQLCIPDDIFYGPKVDVTYSGKYIGQGSPLDDEPKFFPEILQIVTEKDDGKVHLVFDIIEYILDMFVDANIHEEDFLRRFLRLFRISKTFKRILDTERQWSKFMNILKMVDYPLQFLYMRRLISSIPEVKESEVETFNIKSTNIDFKLKALIHPKLVPFNWHDKVSMNITGYESETSEPSLWKKVFSNAIGHVNEVLRLGEIFVSNHPIRFTIESSQSQFTIPHSKYMFCSLLYFINPRRVKTVHDFMKLIACIKKLDSKMFAMIRHIQFYNSINWMPFILQRVNQLRELQESSDDNNSKCFNEYHEEDDDLDDDGEVKPKLNLTLPGKSFSLDPKEDEDNIQDLIKRLRDLRPIYDMVYVLDKNLDQELKEEDDDDVDLSSFAVVSSTTANGNSFFGTSLLQAKVSTNNLLFSAAVGEMALRGSEYYSFATREKMIYRRLSERITKWNWLEKYDDYKLSTKAKKLTKVIKIFDEHKMAPAAGKTLVKNYHFKMLQPMRTNTWWNVVLGMTENQWNHIKWCSKLNQRHSGSYSTCPCLFTYGHLIGQANYCCENDDSKDEIWLRSNVTMEMEYVDATIAFILVFFNQLFENDSFILATLGKLACVCKSLNRIFGKGKIIKLSLTPSNLIWNPMLYYLGYDINFARKILLGSIGIDNEGSEIPDSDNEEDDDNDDNFRTQLFDDFENSKSTEPFIANCNIRTVFITFIARNYRIPHDRLFSFINALHKPKWVEQTIIRRMINQSIPPARICFDFRGSLGQYLEQITESKVFRYLELKKLSCDLSSINSMLYFYQRSLRANKKREEETRKQQAERNRRDQGNRLYSIYRKRGNKTAPIEPLLKSRMSNMTWE